MTGQRWLQRLIRDDSGQALVVAIAVVVIGMLLALSAVAVALNAGQQSTHDERNRGAQQAADAGIQQQLYDQSDSDAVGYDLTGGPIGLGTFLDCNVRKLNSLNVPIGVIQIQVSAGVCPNAVTSTCSFASTCTPDVVFSPVSNEDYYESEFFPNKETQGSSSSDDVIEFPEILSVGCHTTATGSQGTSCSSGSTTNSYSRQLGIADPTGPLDAIEGENNVTLNSTLTNLTSILQSDIPCVTVLFITTCSLTGPLSGLTSLLGSLLGLDNQSSIVSQILDGVGNIAVVDGNISAGNNLTVPTTMLDVNTSTNTLSPGLTDLTGVLTNLVGTLSNLGSLNPTFEYGGTCTQGTSACSSTGLLVNSGTYVHTGGVCTAGTPSTSCTVARQTFQVSAAPTLTSTVTTICGTSCTYSATGTSAYDLSVNSGGTITFTPGTYVFCNFSAPSNATVTSSGTGAVQIYILSPSSSYCDGNTGWNSTPSTQGNFAAASGVTNALSVSSSSLLTLVNGTTASVTNGVLAPSAMQIYVQGNTADTLTVGGNATPTTSVTIGGSSASATQALVVYAPRSTVNINTAGAFEGSAVGWNTTITALAILQDLDLGNYPLSSAVNSYQLEQTVQCDNSVESLTTNTTDLSGC